MDFEASFFEKDGDSHPIDLSDDVAEGRVRIFAVSLREIARFRDRFDPVYVEALDPGETEALAHLVQSSESFLISSGDAIVYRVLGRLGLGDQGLSLEEVLRKVGRSSSGRSTPRRGKSMRPRARA